MAYIELKGMTFHAYHGVLEQERIVGNIYTVDLRIYLDLEKAGLSDNLNETVNYALVHECVKREMQIPSSLIEHVAHRITDRVLIEFPLIRKVRIRLAKRNPPMGADMEECAVVLKRTKSFT